MFAQVRFLRAAATGGAAAAAVACAGAPRRSDATTRSDDSDDGTLTSRDMREHLSRSTSNIEWRAWIVALSSGLQASMFDFDVRSPR